MATIAVATGINSSCPKLIAPRWHTVLFVALFLALTLGGAFFQREARSEPGRMLQHPNVVPLYLSLIAMEWGLFFYVWKGGLRRSGTKLRDLIGGRWQSLRDVALDAILALGIWTVWMIIEKGWEHWFGPEHAASIQTFLPRRGVEILLWVAICQRRDLRRSGLSRLLPKAIRSVHRQQMACTMLASGAVWDIPRLPGGAGVREDRHLRRIVRVARTVARKSSAGNNRTRRLGHLKRDLQNMSDER
jgi:hypothetical protein